MKPIPLKFKNKLYKDRFSVGLDIGASTVKAIKLKISKEKTELLSFILEPTEVDCGPALKKVAQTCDTKKINLSISGPSTIIRYVDFPRMNEDELKQALKFEAEKYIPFSMPEVNLDSHILRADLPDNKMLIMLVAAKKDFVNQRLKLIEDAGLIANIIDVDSIALVNAFNFNYSDDDNIKGKAVALLNIGRNFTNLNILESGVARLSRDIQIAGNNFTQKLQDTLGMDLKAAEELKLNPDKERLDKTVKVVELVLSNLAREIRASFDYYESQSASNVVKILLSGGSSKIPGLKDMLTNLLSMEVEYWDPLRKIDIANNIDSQNIKTISHQFAVAVGLALRQ